MKETDNTVKNTSPIAWLGSRIAQYLTKPVGGDYLGVPTNPEYLAQTLRVGDVLLVEGRSRISSTIKYLTQSTWSHAALYVGDAFHGAGVLLEADMEKGVRTLPLSAYQNMHTRVCRPRELSEEECRQVALYAIARLGNTYDLRHIWDLLRYTLPNIFFKPDMQMLEALTLGSGEPSRAICSSLIAEAFYSVRYPILASDKARLSENNQDGGQNRVHDQPLGMPHHTLFMPRDFDVSPFFDVIKPSAWVTAADYRSRLTGFVKPGLGVSQLAPLLDGVDAASTSVIAAN